MNKQPRITEQTHANLQEAFWQLYTRKGVEHITVREITALAGYNRGTFYLYYRDVYDLLHSIEDNIIVRIDEAVNRAAALPPEQMLPSLLESVAGLLRDSERYTAVLLGEHGDPRFSARLKAVIRPLAGRCFAPCAGRTEAETELLTEFYLSGALGAVVRWNTGNTGVAGERLIELLITAVMPKTAPAKSRPTDGT